MSDTINKMVETPPSGQVIPRGSPSGAPQIKSVPRCGRCGTDIEAGKQFCDVCQEIMDQAKPPQATIIIVREVEKKPEPEKGDAE